MEVSDYAIERKNEFSFSSPKKVQSLSPKKYEILQQSTKVKNREFQQRNSRASRNTQHLKNQLQFLSQENLVQFEKLLLEISRLHNLCYDMERSKILEVQKVRDQLEYQLHNHISHLKQTHVGKILILENQLKNTKNLLQNKNQKYKELQRLTQRQCEILSSENQRLKNQIKNLIQKRVDQVYKIKMESDQQLLNTKKENEKIINQLKDQYNEEIYKIKKVAAQKEKQYNRYKDEMIVDSQYWKKFVKDIETQKGYLQIKLYQGIQKSNLRYEAQKIRLLDILEHELNNSQKIKQLQTQILRKQIQVLKEIIVIKDQEINKYNVFCQSQSLNHKLQINRYEQQNKGLQDKIKTLKAQQLKEVQFFKVKMAVIHQQDIRSLVSLYQTKIQGLSIEAKRWQQQTNRIRIYLQQEMHKKYQMKKKYDFEISKLNGRLLSVKTGMQSMQDQFKQKIQNERSLMLITSKSFIKEAQLKDSNIKFYQQQLKKIRNMLQSQIKESQIANRNVEEKIKLTQEQLLFLSNKIIKIKSENEEKQIQYKLAIDKKDHLINDLHREIIENNIIVQTQVELRLQGQIQLLRKDILEKQKLITNLKDNSQQNQRLISYYKTELEQLKLDTQISQTQSKERYRKIAEENLKELKTLYQRRLGELQEDKQSLKKLNTNQSQNITNLILKYNDLESSLEKIKRQNQRLTDLQTKIINLGVNNNLVKNMAQLFRN